MQSLIVPLGIGDFVRQEGLQTIQRVIVGRITLRDPDCLGYVYGIHASQSHSANNNSIQTPHAS